MDEDNGNTTIFIRRNKESEHGLPKSRRQSAVMRSVYSHSHSHSHRTMVSMTDQTVIPKWIYAVRRPSLPAPQSKPADSFVLRSVEPIAAFCRTVALYTLTESEYQMLNSRLCEIVHLVYSCEKQS